MADLVRVLDVRVDFLFEEAANPDDQVVRKGGRSLAVRFHLGCCFHQFR
jgi:hypothetical protein